MMNTNLVIIAVILCFGAALAYMIFISAREWSTLRYLSEHGELTDATVTKLIKDTSGRGTRYYIKCIYCAGGNYYKAKQLISYKHYEQFQQQDSVTIRIVLAKPNWSRLGKSDFDNTARNTYSLAAIVGCMVFPPFILLWVVSLLGTYWYISMVSTEKKMKR